MRGVQQSPAPAGRWAALLATACAAAVCLSANDAAADNISYAVSQNIGSGGVTGTIVTDGVIGLLKQSDFVSFSLTLKGSGATLTLNSSSAAVQLSGNAVQVSTQALTFDYGATAGSYLLFQDKASLYSGYKYWCNSVGGSVCLAGATVAPAGYTDPTAQFDKTLSGCVTLGLAPGGAAPSTCPASSTTPNTPTTPDQPIGPDQPNAQMIDAGGLLDSFSSLNGARQAQMINHQYYSHILLGLNEQVSCGNCGGSDFLIGSAAISAHGRYTLAPEWTLFGGADIGRSGQRGAEVELNVGFASALQYDPAGFGASRPYASVSLSGAWQKVQYQRPYAQFTSTFAGAGRTTSYDLSIGATAGWVDRLTPRDEAAAYVNYTRQWQFTGRYAEAAVPTNPLAAAYSSGVDVMNLAGVGVQFTHLFTPRIEANLNGGATYSFDGRSGLKGTVAGADVAGNSNDFIYYEFGGRLGLRVFSGLTVDLFINRIEVPRAIGSSTHGGFGVRWSF